MSITCAMRERVGMRDRQEGTPDLHALGPAGGPAVQEQPRWPAAAHDFDILPEHAARVTCSERLHRRFFGGETAGEVRGGVPPLGTIGNLPGGEHALQEALAVSFEHVCEPGDIGGVEPDAENVHA